MREARVMAWTRPAVRALKPYYQAPVAGDPLRLDQNTNLFGPNPALLQATTPPMDQYPSRDADRLLAALAEHHGLSPAHFCVGNGSDEVLDLITKAFGGRETTLATLQPPYSLYPFYATLQEMEFVVARDAESLIEEGAKITILASPNNPTGQSVPDHVIESLLDGDLVVVDEAYGDYADHPSWLSRVDEFDNLLVMRTFSKAYGLAGARVGYVAGNPDLIARLLLVKPPFNLNSWSEDLAVRALAEQDWLGQVVAETKVQRERLEGGLAKRGFRVTPSQANFVLADHTVDPAHIAHGLKRQAILVRTFPGRPGLEQAVRFGVGTADHVDRLLAALDEVLP